MMKAELYDLDGLVIHSPLPFPIGAVSEHFRVRPVNYEPPPIVPLTRDVDETYAMSVKQIFAYIASSMRSVDRDTWYFLWERTADIYGNTGGPNKRPWIDMTVRTLEKGLVYTRFKDIFFRPSGVSGVESKGAAILELITQYDDVTHYDDDPWVIFGLAKAFPAEKFPGVKFILVQELDAGILATREELERFPNVRREAWREILNRNKRMQ
ncbi:MAG: hypothetical protein NT149_00495 [Candidatus Gottesmanbacteria bacterium]|nr:hypothetical protein [Candidatus Gottesmanbacteria bacterium]